MMVMMLVMMIMIMMLQDDPQAGALPLQPHAQGDHNLFK